MLYSHFKLIFAARIVDLSLFAVELLVSAFVKGGADIAHHFVVEIKIVNYAKTHCKLLARLEEVADVSTAVIAARLALAKRIYRTGIVKILFVI